MSLIVILNSCANALVLSSMESLVYGLYFMRRGAVVVVLRAGGDKRTQDADI